MLTLTSLVDVNTSMRIRQPKPSTDSRVRGSPSLSHTHMHTSRPTHTFTHTLSSLHAVDWAGEPRSAFIDCLLTKRFFRRVDEAICYGKFGYMTAAAMPGVTMTCGASQHASCAEFGARSRPPPRRQRVDKKNVSSTSTYDVREASTSMGRLTNSIHRLQLTHLC